MTNYTRSFHNKTISITNKSQLETVEAANLMRYVEQLETTVADYTKRLFGMFGGEDALVTMFCESSLAGVILDRFGRDVLLVPEENGFRFSAHVCLSPVFYGWVISFGGMIRILSPDAAHHGLRQTLQEATASLG